MLAQARAYLFTNRTWGQTVLKNAAWIFVGEGVSRLLKLAATFLIVRQFGPTDFGRFTFAFAVATMLSIAFDAGMVTVVTREYAKDPAKATSLPDMLGLKFTLGAVVMLVAVGVAFAVTGDRTITYMIVVLAAALFVGEIVNLGFAVIRARQRMEYETLARTASGLMLFGIVLGILWLAPTLGNISEAYLLAGVGTVAITAGMVANLRLPLTIRFRPRAWWPVLRVALPLALYGVATTLYVNMDAAMLGFYGRLTEAGWYGAAIRVNGVVVVPMSIMGLVLFPALSQLDGATFNRRWQMWAFGSAAVGVGLVVVLIAAAEPLVRLAFGADFEPAAGVLRVTILGIGLMYAYFPWMQRLIIRDRQVLLLYIVGGAAILNAALNAALIPSFGMYGAAWATVATHAVIFGALVIVERRKAAR